MKNKAKSSGWFTPWQIWAILLGLGIIGLAVITWGVLIKGWSQVWLGTFGAALVSTWLSAATIGLLFEVFFRKKYLEEAMDLAKIGESLRSAGIREFQMGFLSFDFKDFFRNAREVDIYVNYAQTWLEQHAPLLKELFKRGAKVRYFLNDPDDNAVLEGLSQKWQEEGNNKYSADDLRRRITAVLDRLDNIRFSSGDVAGPPQGLFEVYLTRSDVPYSFYRSDDKLLLVPTKICRDKDHPVPYLILEKTGSEAGFFEWVMQDLTKSLQAPGAKLYERNENDAIEKQ